MLGSLSSCGHLDVEKSPSVGETNGMATGSRYIGRSDSLQSFGSKSDPLFPTYCASTCICCWILNLNLTTNLIPSPFFSPFPFFLFRLVALVEGRQEETPQWARQCLWETPLFPRGFFRFPVWSAGESFSTSCQNGASATRPHCLLHTDLLLQSQQDLLYCYYSLPSFFPTVIIKGCCAFS